MRHAFLVGVVVLALPRVAAAQISGTVVDAAQQPVAGARVSVRASDTETLTDATGAFDLPTATGDVVVVAARKGFFLEPLSVTAPRSGIQFDTRIPALESDVTNYRFVIPEVGGQLDVTARLIYRRSWRALVDAKGWTTDGHGNPLEDVEAPHFGHLMEVAVDGVAAAPEVEDPPPDAGPLPDIVPGGGCSCAVPSGDASDAWWLLLAAAAFFARRRV